MGYSSDLQYQFQKLNQQLEIMSEIMESTSKNLKNSKTYRNFEIPSQSNRKKNERR